MQQLNEFVVSINDALTGYILIIALFGAGIWFSFR